MFFIDLEASSLLQGSYPIEVAWVGADGEGESYLIRPHPDWIRTGRWDTQSELVHGISRETLAEDGDDLEFVAGRVLACLAGQKVYSDAPAFDGDWLDTLMQYAGREERIRLEPVDQAYTEVFRPILERTTSDRERGMASALCSRFVAAAERKEADRVRVRHRALGDASGLWRVWRSVADQAADWL